MKLTLYSLLFIIQLCFSQAYSQEDKVWHYPKNLILKGFVKDARNDSVFANQPINVLAYNEIRLIYTSKNGEYEVNFADTTGASKYESFNIEDGTILFIWGPDPNLTKTRYLKNTKLRKVYGKEDFTKPPIVLKYNFKIGYEFENN